MTKKELEFKCQLYRNYISLLDNGEMILEMLDDKKLYEHERNLDINKE